MLHDTIEPRADERAARFEVLMDELLPSLRTAYPDFPDEVLLESAVRIAACRLAGEDFVWAER
jgi:hypothetical protein